MPDRSIYDSYLAFNWNESFSFEVPVFEKLEKFIF